MSYISQQLLSAVRQLANIDFSTLAATQFMGKFRVALLEKGYAPAFAEELAASVKVELAENQLSPEEITEIAQLYASMVVSLQKALAEQGFTQPEQAVLRKAGSFTLTCG